MCCLDGQGGFDIVVYDARVVSWKQPSCVYIYIYIYIYIQRARERERDMLYIVYVYIYIYIYNFLRKLDQLKHGKVDREEESGEITRAVSVNDVLQDEAGVRRLRS